MLQDFSKDQFSFTHIKPSVICIGEVLLDRFFIPSENSLKMNVPWKEFPGGAPANTACALVKLGIPTAFIGCVGQDKRGEILVRFLRDSGVDCKAIQRHPIAPTRGVNLIYSEGGKSKFFGFDNSNSIEFADSYLQADQLSSFLFEGIKFLVLGTLSLAYPSSRDAIYKAINLAKLHQVEIFVDINWEPMFWKDLESARETILTVIRYADFLKLTDNEANFLFGTIYPKKIVEYLPDIKGVFVTKNELGCTYYLGKHEDRLPAFFVNVVDPTGAGDAFNAGIISQFCRYGIQSLTDQKITKNIVTYASAVGALTTVDLGATAPQPTLTEVESFLFN